MGKRHKQTFYGKLNRIGQLTYEKALDLLGN